MGSMSIMHWAIVAAVVALLFGRNKISGLMEDVAHGIKSFKKGMQDEPDVDAGVHQIHQELNKQVIRADEDVRQKPANS
jgi:sec-independent protein translocase protein TatA